MSVTDTDVNEGLLRMLVVAPMKSASTYVANVIRIYFGIEKAVDLAHVDFESEHNLTPWVCYDVRGKDFCFNFHMLPHPSNLAAAEHEHIGLVVLWRNLADMIVSMDDHQFSEGGTGAIFFVLDPARYRALPPQERYRFMIDTVVPWYLGFYLRWRRLDMVLHPYEQMVMDPHSYFVEILTGIRQGAPLDEGHLDAALSIDPSLVGRFNVGKVGRSAEKFDDATKRRLEKKILSHPDREQLEILLWELPWEATLLKRRSPLDGSVVRSEGSERAHFITSGRAHPIDRPAWLLSRAGGRRLPRTIAEAELRAFPIGDPMI